MNDYERFRRIVPKIDEQSFAECKCGKSCALRYSLPIFVNRATTQKVFPCPSPVCDGAASREDGDDWKLIRVDETFDPMPHLRGGPDIANTPTGRAKARRPEGERSAISQGLKRYWSERRRAAK